MPSWKVWPVPSAAKLKLHLFIHELTGLQAQSLRFSHSGGVALQVEWRGNRQKAENLLKGTRSNCTRRQIPAQQGGVTWNEGFDHPCRLKMSSSRRFKSWIVNLEIHGFTSRWIDTFTILGKAKINVSEFASDRGKSLNIPITCNINGVSKNAELTVTIELFDDLKTNDRTISPFTRALSFQFSNSRRKFRKNYSSIYTNNHSSSLDMSSEDEFRRGTDRRTSKSNDEGPERRHFLSRLLSRKKGLSFSSAIIGHSRNHTPPPNLQQEENRREIGVEDDNSRGSNNADDQVPTNQQHELFPVSGVNDCFEVGNWEKQGVISRDGNMELVTNVFFASIDQCSERADGAGACAVLVAVIADWLHKNHKTVPLRSHFDELIREGSSEWRKLCQNEDNSERFIDHHFDLETVLRSKVRHIEVETYVSFFCIDRMPDNLEYLRETMSFDKVWDNIIVNNNNNTCQDSDVEKIFVVSWNDHFFILKVEKDEIFLIDTLGERLHEGCNQAYILKFSKESVIYRLQKEEEEEQKQQKQQQEQQQQKQLQDNDDIEKVNDVGYSKNVLCEGIASCKEFIKGFLAAVPLRELQEDIERGSLGGHLHRRLQVEFHRTIPLL